MNANNSIQALQFFVTGLSNGAFAHLVQGKHFDSMGFKTLGKKYTDHYSEEMGWVEKFMTRINDLGGEVKIEDQKGRELVKDPVEYVKADYDLMKAYLADEEEDLYWSQEQVEMVEMIGRQNWLYKQL